MSNDDKIRHEFINRIYGFDARSRNHLLSIEQDDEISELKRVATDAQHFEMAVILKNEIDRRNREKPMYPTPAQSGQETPTARQTAKNILAEFVHTQPPPDFMENHVTNHIEAACAGWRNACAKQIIKNEAVGAQLHALQSAARKVVDVWPKTDVPGGCGRMNDAVSEMIKLLPPATEPNDTATPTRQP